MNAKTYVVEPVRFTSAMLTDGNATNAEALWTAGTYAVGTRKLYPATPTRGWMKGISMLRVWESLVDSNTSEPGTDPTKWINMGPANTVAMFTSRLAERTERADGLSVQVSPDAFVSTVAFFGLVGNSLTLTVRSAEGVVRSVETRELITRPGAVDWLTFFFAEHEQLSQALFLPVTCLPGDRLEVDVTGSTAAIARMVFGRLVELGAAPQYGAGWAMDNYTSADPDEFGFVDPDVGDYAPRNNIALWVEPSRSNTVLETLISLRGTPTLLVASEDPNYLGALVNFGLIRDPQYVISGPRHNVLSLEFKGFV